jgi:hypothetical protein
MRKKFNADEKAIIAEAVAQGSPVRWKDASNWSKLALITDGEIKVDTSTCRPGEQGWQYVEATNVTATATCEYGREIRIIPSGIRRP